MSTKRPANVRARRYELDFKQVEGSFFSSVSCKEGSRVACSYYLLITAALAVPPFFAQNRGTPGKGGGGRSGEGRVALVAHVPGNRGRDHGVRSRERSGSSRAKGACLPACVPASKQRWAVGLALWLGYDLLVGC